MGANVSNYGEVHARIAPFIRQFRKRQGVLLNAECNALTEGVGNATPATPPAQPFSTPLAGPEPCAERPYIVAADVKGAFDSIPLEALEKVAVDLVTSSEYDVQRLTRVNGGVTGGFRTKTTREAIQVGGGLKCRELLVLEVMLLLLTRLLLLLLLLSLLTATTPAAC
tara:strand:+ start:511 stop:1014 length:504 start_codon:yes stop_codon:yes gene_type:complete